ncbi:hypothetical protein [Nocardioides pacificus]
MSPVRSTRRPWRRAPQQGLACGLVLGSLLAACSVPGASESSGVLDTGVEPVAMSYPGPTYAAATPAGLLLRAGEQQWVVATGRDAHWLPNGTALTRVARGSVELQTLDPERGPTSVPVRGGGFELPSRSVTQVNVLDSYRLPPTLTAYSLDMERLWSIELPGTDNPEATDFNELARNYYGATPTIDGVTYVLWHDSSEWYEDGDYGLARIEDGDLTNVALNERLIALYLSADGAGLLALRQVKGDPCGGCTVDQEIVEVDPATGELVDYGMPDEYVEEWRVAAMDKVGDRIAVRFTETEWRDGPRGEIDSTPYTVQRGTWVLEDGAWQMVEGSEDELTWWQGEHRVVARVREDEPDSRDGFALLWVRPDGTEEALPGELVATYGRRYISGQVPGQLIPPG